MRNKLVAVAIATVLGTLSISAHADDADINTFSDLFKQGHVDGELRLYQFNRSYDYDVAAKPSARAFGGSLLLNAQTASLDGFSARFAGRQSEAGRYDADGRQRFAYRAEPGLPAV
jgi:hypothetical protein